MSDVFVIRRRHDHAGEIASLEAGGDGTADPVEQYLAVYDTEEAALWAARELERADAVVNGTAVKAFAGGFAAATTLPVFALRDWMLDEGIPVPETDSITDWRLWWVRVRDADRPISRAQFRHVLAALNRLPLTLYQVHRTPRGDDGPLPGVGYAVIHRDWRYDDSRFQGDNEAVAVYRTREAAEAEVERRTAAERRQTLGRPGERHWSDDVSGFAIVELPLHPED